MEEEIVMTEVAKPASAGSSSSQKRIEQVSCLRQLSDTGGSEADKVAGCGESKITESTRWVRSAI
jgi:hypothetical protein